MVVWMEVEFTDVHDELDIVMREVRITYGSQDFSSSISYERSNTEFLFSLSLYLQCSAPSRYSVKIFVVQ